MKYVIIGNSAAAVGCMEGIRKTDKKGDICVISDERYHTYSRPLISYLLCAKTDEERMKYRDNDFYADNKCEVRLGLRVTQIDARSKSITTSDGERIAYDKLLVATGSRAFVPPTEGYENVKDKFTFMSLDDAKALREVLGADKRVLIIGAGLIGLKCAEGISGQCKSITVVDMASRVLPNVLNEEAADIMRKHLNEKGIKIFTDTKVDKYEGQTALLSNAQTTDFDILVTAVGVRPNTELLTEAGAKAQRGVVIDEYCKTSLEDIYAAGDVTQFHDVSSGTDKIMAIMPNAYLQGECAGVNMAGGCKEFTNAIPMNSTGLLGLHIITAGTYEGDCYIRKTKDSYKALFYKDDLLKGFILMGEVARAGIYTSLIRERKPLYSIDFELIEQKPQLMAFERKERFMLMNRGF